MCAHPIRVPPLMPVAELPCRLLRRHAQVWDGAAGFGARPLVRLAQVKARSLRRVTMRDVEADVPGWRRVD